MPTVTPADAVLLLILVLILVSSLIGTVMVGVLLPV
jgi:hypothetical protein